MILELDSSEASTGCDHLFGSDASISRIQNGGGSLLKKMTLHKCVYHGKIISIRGFSPTRQLSSERSDVRSFELTDQSSSTWPCSYPTTERKGRGPETYLLPPRPHGCSASSLSLCRTYRWSCAIVYRYLQDSTTEKRSHEHDALSHWKILSDAHFTQIDSQNYRDRGWTWSELLDFVTIPWHVWRPLWCSLFVLPQTRRNLGRRTSIRNEISRMSRQNLSNIDCLHKTRTAQSDSSSSSPSFSSSLLRFRHNMVTKSFSAKSFNLVTALNIEKCPRSSTVDTHIKHTFDPSTCVELENEFDLSELSEEWYVPDPEDGAKEHSC